MGDMPSRSSDTPFYMGTISKSWSDEGRMLEVKGVGDTGCTSTTVPIAVVRDHGLKIEDVDPDEPGMQALGGA